MIRYLNWYKEEQVEKDEECEYDHLKMLIGEATDAYKEEVLPNAVRKRMVVEAAESFGWHRFIGLDGDSVTMNRFGASAPGGTCLKEFGFTVENVVAKAKALLG